MNTMIYDRYPGTPDLTGIFIGDAGTFGIKVEATYRMYRYAPLRTPLAFYYDSFDHAWEAMQYMSTFEPLPYYHMVMLPLTEFLAHMGQESPLVILIAKGNTQKELDAKVEIINEAMTKNGGRVAQGEQVEAWKTSGLTGQRAREMGLLGSAGVWTYFEYFVSRSQVSEAHHTLKDFIYGRLKEKGITEYNSNEGCIGSGATSWILTFIIFLPGEDKYAREVIAEAFAEATDLACSHGWYPDCHQGYGSRVMAKYWPKHHYEFMKKLKTALDPNNIMNPGVWDF